MSDRSQLSFQVHSCDPDKLTGMREYLDNEDPQWSDPPPRSGDVMAGYVEEMRLGSVGEITAELLEIDPGGVFTVWQDPKYEYLGDVAMHHPELGMFTAPCDSDGTVVLSWEQLMAAPSTATGFAEAFGRPWIDRIEQIREES